jgi:hypothetical protein
LKLRLAAVEGAPVFYREHAQQTSKRKVLMLQGSELTRMRMLLFLEKTGTLTRLIKRFVPFFPIVLKLKLHLNRPFTSEFLFTHIINHQREFDKIFIRQIQKSIEALKRHELYLLLDKNEFRKNLESFKGSPTFTNFEETFLKG